MYDAVHYVQAKNLTEQRGSARRTRADVSEDPPSQRLLVRRADHHSAFYAFQASTRTGVTAHPRYCTLDPEPVETRS